MKNWFMKGERYAEQNRALEKDILAGYHECIASSKRKREVMPDEFAKEESGLLYHFSSLRSSNARASEEIRGLEPHPKRKYQQGYELPRQYLDH